MTTSTRTHDTQRHPAEHTLHELMASMWPLFRDEPQCVGIALGMDPDSGLPRRGVRVDLWSADEPGRMLRGRHLVVRYCPEDDPERARIADRCLANLTARLGEDGLGELCRGHETLLITPNVVELIPARL